MYGLGIPKPLGYSDSADLQRSIELTLDGSSVFQNKVQKVLYKLVVVTYPPDHSGNI